MLGVAEAEEIRQGKMNRRRVDGGRAVFVPARVAAKRCAAWKKREGGYHVVSATPGTLALYAMKLA